MIKIKLIKGNSSLELKLGKNKKFTLDHDNMATWDKAEITEEPKTI